MPLIGKHSLTIDQSLVVVLVMQSSCSGTTSTDTEVWLSTANVVVLLATVDEEAFKLALAHARLAVFHDRAMGLSSDLS